MVLIRQLICSFFMSSSFFRCFGIPFTSSSFQTQQTDLPSEIITEILLRLPVKSLLRFRCVSKSWRSLISQPEFAKTHLSLASMNTDYTHHKLILLNKFSIEIKSCSLHSILNKQSCIGVELDCPLKVAPATIVGCVDGLVCIAAKWDVHIWNPATRKSKKMPSFIKPCYSSIARYGFGYDESTDDYKVVILTRCAEYTGVEPEVKVCTLRTASWRRIGGFPYRLLPDGSGIFLSGMLHWFLSGESNRIIVSLDLVKETYGEVPEPDYDEDERLYENRLDVLNGWLCILRTGWDRAEVWVMKEYGVGESWTKLLVIPYMPPPRDYMHSPPLCILEKNGEFLFHLRSEFVLRNPKDGIFSYPMIRNCSSCSTVHLYVESLVSPVIDADSGV